MVEGSQNQSLSCVTSPRSFHYICHSTWESVLGNAENLRNTEKSVSVFCIIEFVFSVLCNTEFVFSVLCICILYYVLHILNM